MKTKIIYISGNEIFNIADIRSAFEQVRCALNLDKTTVLFGVPVDAEDAGFAAQLNEFETISDEEKSFIIDENTNTESKTIKEIPEISAEITESVVQSESIIEQPVKKRGRPRKEDKIENDAETITEPVIETHDELIAESKEQNEPTIVPILSVLSTDEETPDKEVPDVTLDVVQENSDEPDVAEVSVDEEADLEKLLSAMTPMEEDIIEEPQTEDVVEVVDSAEISVDATLEQLATEFAENQDKITSESKSTSRSKISKLRSILPFKQSKHKDQGLGDLFGWAGVAANDEDFSVPGFFTSAAGKK